MERAHATTRRARFSRRIRSIDVIAATLILSCITLGCYFFAASHSRMSLAFPVLGGMGVAAAWAWYRLRDHSDSFTEKALFPTALVLLALMYGFAFPPGSVPDEFYHFRASYYYANLIEHFDDPHVIRAEDKEALEEKDFMSQAITSESFDKIKDNLGPFAEEDGTTTSTVYSNFIDTMNITSNLPQLKVPAAIGIAIAKLAGLNALWVYYFGMLFNLAFGAALIIASVRITPYGKKVFMAIALLPMTLHLLGSQSYDIGTIGFAFLLTALIFRAMARSGQMGRGEIAAIIVTACLLAPCKVVYTPIVFLAALIPDARFSSKRHAILVKASILLAPIAAVLLFRLPSMLVMAGIIQSDTPNAVKANVETYSVGGLASQPLHTLGLFFATLFELGWSYLFMFVGSSLGWFQANIIAPHYVTVALLAILALAAMPSPEDDVVLPNGTRIACAVVFACISLATMLALCVDWTPVTDNVIAGVQGRYFIPCAPLLFMAMRSRAIASSRWLTFALLIALIAIDSTYTGYIFIRI